MEPQQVGWVVRWRDENTDPASDSFGTVTEWWELFDLIVERPKGSQPVYVVDPVVPVDWDVS